MKTSRFKTSLDDILVPKSPGQKLLRSRFIDGVFADVQQSNISGGKEAKQKGRMMLR